jgi:hypothetical protein
MAEEAAVVVIEMQGGLCPPRREKPDLLERR